MRNARLAMILAALGALGLGLWAQGCLFAPDDCKDLLKCGGAGGAGGAGGGGSTSSAATSSAAMSSTGTSGCTSEGCPACVVDADCGEPTLDGCTASACVASICKPKATEGLPSITQTPNDCKKSVCGVDGKPILEVDPSDPPADDSNPCTEELCAEGAPMVTPAAAGTPCPGGSCDGAGVCVNCVSNADCTVGLNPTCDATAHTCISCSDGVKNGSETGVDCGGTCNKKCGGDPCSKAFDCSSTHCVDSVCCDTSCTGVCKACNVAGLQGTCSNVPVGQTDNGTCTNAATQTCDGAGNCKKAGGISCASDGECLSGACVAGACRVPTGGTCTDDVACASGRCSFGKCADCSAGNQCSSLLCSAPTCKAPGGAPCEIDGDCAGNKCQFNLCLLDSPSACATHSDCRSGVCKNNKCSPCFSNGDCTGNTTCGNTTFGFSSCTLPSGSYCTASAQCGGIGICQGFPAKCN